MSNDMSELGVEQGVETLKTALLKLVSLDKELGMSADQRMAMETKIKEEVKEFSEEHLKETIHQRVAERFADSTTQLIREKVDAWCDDNIASRVQSQLDEMMCERTRATIEEYDIVRYTDDGFHSAINEQINIEDHFDNWFQYHSIEDHIDLGALADRVAETVSEQIGDDGTIEEKVKDNIGEEMKEHFKKVLHSILGFAYFKDMLSPSEIIDSKDRHKKEAEEAPEGWLSPTEVSNQKLMADRYEHICSLLKLESSSQNDYEKIKEKAAEMGNANV